MTHDDDEVIDGFMTCMNCGEEFNCENDEQSRYHEAACIGGDMLPERPECDNCTSPADIQIEEEINRVTRYGMGREDVPVLRNYCTPCFEDADIENPEIVERWDDQGSADPDDIGDIQYQAMKEGEYPL